MNKIKTLSCLFVVMILASCSSQHVVAGNTSPGGNTETAQASSDNTANQRNQSANTVKASRSQEGMKTTGAAPAATR
jgi:hypothetical protein